MKVTWLFLAVCMSSNYVYARSASEIFIQASKSVVIVNAYDEQSNLKNTGSGVVVEQGEILTNCHILQGSTYYRITSGDKTNDSTLIYADKKNDLCLLIAPEVKNPVVKVGKASSLKVGSQVYAIGSPQGLELYLSEGLVSQLRGDKSVPLIQTTAPLSFGSSGGGLFDTMGKLVGIATFQIIDGQNLNFAMPIEHLANLKSGKNFIRNVKLVAAEVTPAKLNQIDSRDLPNYIFIARGEPSKDSFYIKKGSIKKLSNGLVQAWILEEPDLGLFYRSALQLNSVNCIDNSIVLLKVVFYDEKLAEGKVKKIFDYDNPKPDYPTPNSINESILNAVCGFAS